MPQTDRERRAALYPQAQPVAYAVVHTIGSGHKLSSVDDDYPEIARFETDRTLDFDPAYSNALALCAEIREHEGHWARIDAILANGERVIR